MSHKYDLIICDIDGCLISENASAFDLESLHQIAKHNQLAAKQQDRPMLTVCSGRPQPFTESLCRLLHNLTVPCIAENGVWLYHPGTNEYLMDPAITEEHLRSIADAELWLRSEFGRLGLTIQPGKAASISLYCGTHERVLEMLPIVRDATERNGRPLRISHTWSYINCDLDHISKATGIRRLFDLIGIDPRRTAGIGDTMGDLAIAENVEWFACPSNASHDIKPHAHYVSPYSEAKGVVDILLHFPTN